MIGADLGTDTGQEEIRDRETQTDTQRNKNMRETDRRSACLKGCGDLSGVEPSLAVLLGLSVTPPPAEHSPSRPSFLPGTP